MCVRERARKKVFVCVYERDKVFVCLCERGIKREGKKVCVCVCVRERERGRTYDCDENEAN